MQKSTGDSLGAGVSLAFAVCTILEFLFLIAVNAGQGGVAPVVDWFAIPVAGVLAFGWVASRHALRSGRRPSAVLIGAGSCAAVLFLFRDAAAARLVMGISAHYAMVYGILWGALFWNCMAIRNPQLGKGHNVLAVTGAVAVVLLWSCLFWFYLADGWLT